MLLLGITLLLQRSLHTMVHSVKFLVVHRSEHTPFTPQQLAQPVARELSQDAFITRYEVNTPAAVFPAVAHTPLLVMLLLLSPVLAPAGNQRVPAGARAVVSFRYGRFG
jgi:hypothetical protein